jgi:hypothetical protein
MATAMKSRDFRRVTDWSPGLDQRCLCNTPYINENAVEYPEKRLQKMDPYRYGAEVDDGVSSLAFGTVHNPVDTSIIR